MPEPSRAVLDVAREAGRLAASLCRRVQARIPAVGEAREKAGREPVTVADYGSQALILRQVAAAFPGHGVVAEEGAEHLREHAADGLGNDLVSLVSDSLGEPVTFEDVCRWIDHRGPAESEFTWVIDPIDGTKGFLRREQYAVAIGVLRASEPWAGVLVCPNLPVAPGEPDGARGVLLAAARGRGAHLEPLDGGAAGRPLRTSELTDPQPGRILGSVESSHGDPALLGAILQDLGLGGGVVRIDSQAKYALVAGGEAEIYVRPQSRPDYREKVWDHAAGVVVVKEAGGRVTDLDGRPLDFSHGARLETNRGVVATNGPLHDAVLASVARAERSG